MEQLVVFWNRLTSIQIVDIIIAIGIIVFFRILSGTFSYMIIRIFKIKSKKAKEIKRFVRICFKRSYICEGGSRHG